MEEDPAFAVLPTRSSTGAADWKYTKAGLGGSIVLAGSPRVPGIENLLDNLKTLEPGTPWESLPLIYMRDGIARITSLDN